MVRQGSAKPSSTSSNLVVTSKRFLEASASGIFCFALSSPSQSPAVTDSPFCRYATSSPGRGKSFLKGRVSGETGHFAVKQKSLPQHPLSHGLHRASSPKGTPLSYTGNFAATTEAVPLGKVAKPQALTEGVSQKRTPPVAYGDSPL